PRDPVDVLEAEGQIDLPTLWRGVERRHNPLAEERVDAAAHELGGEAAAAELRGDQDHADPAEPAGEVHRKTRGDETAVLGESSEAVPMLDHQAPVGRDLVPARLSGEAH